MGNSCSILGDQQLTLTIFSLRIFRHGFYEENENTLRLPRMKTTHVVRERTEQRRTLLCRGLQRIRRWSRPWTAFHCCHASIYQDIDSFNREHALNQIQILIDVSTTHLSCEWKMHYFPTIRPNWKILSCKKGLQSKSK